MKVIDKRQKKAEAFMGELYEKLQGKTFVRAVSPGGMATDGTDVYMLICTPKWGRESKKTNVYRMVNLNTGVLWNYGDPILSEWIQVTAHVVIEDTCGY